MSPSTILFVVGIALFIFSKPLVRGICKIFFKDKEISGALLNVSSGVVIFLGIALITLAAIGPR